MNIDKDLLLAKIAEYDAAAKQHLANANACQGAADALKQLVIENDDTDTEDK